MMKKASDNQGAKCEKAVMYDEDKLRMVSGGVYNTGHLCPACGSDNTESWDGDTHSFKCFACGYRTF